MARSIVIVGAGQAGGTAAKTLRMHGYSGRIVLLAAERYPPYERPPLSKAVLAGVASPDSTYLLKHHELSALGIDIRYGIRATRIDRARKRVWLASGDCEEYDALILTTGGSARKLAVPGGNSERVRYLRTIEDALAIRAAIGPEKRLVIIGGGFIGLEIAATARTLGAAVQVVESLGRLCARSVPEMVSEYLLRRHERAGTRVLLNVQVCEMEHRGAITVVRLSDGSALEADVVVVGVGLEPDVTLAREAGLAVENGVLVDDQGRTSDPDIFAAGDCANALLPCLGRRVRLESWANAQSQGTLAAMAAVGQSVHYDEIPWFWSDQYDVNLQILGLPAIWPVPWLRGDPTRGSFSAFFLEGRQIVAVASVNAPRELRAARRLMQTRHPVNPEDLMNTARPLQSLCLEPVPKTDN